MLDHFNCYWSRLNEEGVDYVENNIRKNQHFLFANQEVGPTTLGKPILSKIWVPELYLREATLLKLILLSCDPYVVTDPISGMTKTNNFLILFPNMVETVTPKQMFEKMNNSDKAPYAHVNRVFPSLN